MKHLFYKYYLAIIKSNELINVFLSNAQKQQSFNANTFFYFSNFSNNANSPIVDPYYNEYPSY